MIAQLTDKVVSGLKRPAGRNRRCGNMDDRKIVYNFWMEHAWQEICVNTNRKPCLDYWMVTFLTVQHASQRPKAIIRHYWPFKKRIYLLNCAQSTRNIRQILMENHNIKINWWLHYRFGTLFRASNHIIYVKSGWKIANNSKVAPDRGKSSLNRLLAVSRGLAFEWSYFLR